jgi:protein-arginine kinase activator protein McsA
MGKFDELFNDFMNDGVNNNNKDDSADIMANIFNKLSNLNGFDKNGMMEELNESLGEPDDFKNYEENGMFFQKQIWNTKHGQVIKTIISDVPFAKEKTKAKKTRIPLEVQLLSAVKEENYELAAKLRDRINKKK